MTYLTFNPNPPPSAGSRVMVAYRILPVSFGDGYEQRTIDGINAKGLTANLKWDNLVSATELQTILDFFDATLGVTPFYWTPPGSSTPLKWVVDTKQQNQYEISYTNGVISSLQVPLKQVFDLDT